MSNESNQALIDLAAVLEKHSLSIEHTNNDDCVHIWRHFYEGGELEAEEIFSGFLLDENAPIELRETARKLNTGIHTIDKRNIKIARLWVNGKMVGGDEDEVIESILSALDQFTITANDLVTQIENTDGTAQISTDEIRALLNHMSQ